MKIGPLLFLSVMLLSAKAFAGQPMDVFVLAIGSRSYITSKEPAVQHLSDIPGAAKSANIVAELLHKGGAKYGLTLVSDSAHFVGMDDVYAAFPVIWGKMVKEKTHRPLVVVYIAAHGVADGYSWYQYILPGNFLYRGDLEDLAEGHGVEMAQKTIFVATIVDYLRGWKVPFIILIDTCYEGAEYIYKWKPALPDINAPCPPNDISGFCRNLVSSSAMAAARKAEQQRAAYEANINQMFLSYRETNKFKSTYPVMFSVEPGKAVPTVADPDDIAGSAIAPLARRMMLILAKRLGARQPLSLGSFIREMASSSLDKLTNPGVIYSTIPAGADDAYLIDGSAPGNGEVEIRYGTATTPVMCCSGQF